MVALRSDETSTAIQTLQSVLDDQHLLADVVRWCIETPDTAIVNVVVQDEFTHDVIVRHGAIWLVYDAT